MPEKKCHCLNRMDGLFFVLMALKLTGAVSWSWWIITAPLWVPVLYGSVKFIGQVGYEMARRNGAGK